VLLPKNLKTAQLLGKALESREGIEKYYLAVTEGREICQKRGLISGHMEWTNKHKARLSKEVGGNDRSQKAETAFAVLRKTGLSDIAWRHVLGLKLLTGRKHQIRCQLSEYLLNPILNDELYRGKACEGMGEGIMLHAFGLRVNEEGLVKDVLKLGEMADGIAEGRNSAVISKNNGVVTIVAPPPSCWSP
jgi:23S rRNA-/tRNA-specific pseudouridylate synthase